MKKARVNRAVAATKCNEYSSRSHFIFQMKIYGENFITGEKCDGKSIFLCVKYLKYVYFFKM